MKIKSKFFLILTSFIVTISLSCAPNIANYGTPNANSKFEYVAGNSDKGLVDGNVNEAKFNNPTGMAVDERNGDLYVLDQNRVNESGIGNHAIRKITPDGRVSTVVKVGEEEILTESIKVKDNFLYFANQTSVKKFNLTGDIKIENVVGTDNKGHVTGDFEIVRFNGINSITLDNEDNIFILEMTIIKKANLKARKVETLQFQSEGSKANTLGEPLISPKDPSVLSAGRSSNLTINPKNNHLYYEASSTFYAHILEINEKHQIMDTDAGLPGSFTFDKEGNIYNVSISEEKLLKIPPDNKTEELSGFSGVLKIEKGNQFPEFGNWPQTNLTVDNDRKILYMSTSENKIYKLKLKG